MSSNRREFLHLLGLGLASAGGPAIVRADTPKRSRGAVPGRFDFGALPILQGPSDATSASFLIQHATDRRLHMRAFGPFNEELTAAVLERFDVPGQAVSVSEVLVAGLVPGVTYRLRVLDDGDRIVDSRRFRSLETSRKNLRFAVGSCMHDRFADAGAPVWTAMADGRFDAVFLVGDTVYADQGNWGQEESGYARRYAEARDRLAWFRMPFLTPTFATWDDHDFGVNNGDKSFTRGAFTKSLFRRYFGSIDNAAWTKAHGVGSVLRAGGQRFFLLDDRTWRDARNVTGGRHLGDAQREWLIAELAKSREPAWLLNGSQFFGAYQGFESYEADHPDDFKDLLATLSKLEAPVAFVGGDIHISEVMKVEPATLGYATFELTASSMHSFAVPFMDARVSNPRRLASEWRYNFLAVESRVGATWNVDVRCVTGDGHGGFARSVEVVRG